MKNIGYWEQLKVILGEVWKTNPDLLLTVVLVTVLGSLVAMISMIISNSRKKSNKVLLDENDFLNQQIVALDEKLKDLSIKLNNEKKLSYHLKTMQWDKLITPEIIDVILTHNKEQKTSNPSSTVQK